MDNLLLKKKKKNNLNINKFTRDLETNLLNFRNNSIYINEHIEPLLSDITQNITDIQNIENSGYVNDNLILTNYSNNDFILLLLLFIIFNNNVIINFINNYIKNGIYINLICRAIIFIFIYYIYKIYL